MHPSQLIFSAIVLFIIYKTIVSYVKKRLSKQFAIIWLALWLAMLSVLLNQQLISEVAKLMGIGRGVDVAVYASIIIIFYLIYSMFIKLQEIEDSITKIVRANALKHASINKKNDKDNENPL